MRSLGLEPAWQQFELLVPVRQRERRAGAGVHGHHAGRLRQPRGPFVSGNAEQHPARGRGQPGAWPASAKPCWWRKPPCAREIEIAQQVQHHAVSAASCPTTAQYALHATYQPHTEVGGDYYDVVEIDAAPPAGVRGRRERQGRAGLAADVQLPGRAAHAAAPAAPTWPPPCAS
ncbi:MAG: hypothetical protein WKG07_46840 [Hymenobacter sp.]